MGLGLAHPQGTPGDSGSLLGPTAGRSLSIAGGSRRGGRGWPSSFAAKDEGPTSGGIPGTSSKRGIAQTPSPRGPGASRVVDAGTKGPRWWRLHSETPGVGPGETARGSTSGQRAWRETLGKATAGPEPVARPRANESQELKLEAGPGVRKKARAGAGLAPERLGPGPNAAEAAFEPGP